MMTMIVRSNGSGVTDTYLSRVPKYGGKCHLLRRAAALFSAAILFATVAAAEQSGGFRTTVQPYAVSVSAEYVVVPLLSVGDRVPHTSDASKQYQMIGVPDGLGAY